MHGEIHDRSQPPHVPRGTAAALAAASKGPTTSAQTPKKGGTLRFIPIGDLKILDPIWTTAYITRDHGYMVYDTLFANDANLRPSRRWWTSIPSAATS